MLIKVGRSFNLLVLLMICLGIGGRKTWQVYQTCQVSLNGYFTTFNFPCINV
jgi:hypothetical protein